MTNTQTTYQSKITYKGTEFDFEAAGNLMDRDLTEELQHLVLLTNQQWFDAYVAAHLAKFGEEFVIN